MGGELVPQFRIQANEKVLSKYRSTIRQWEQKSRVADIVGRGGRKFRAAVSYVSPSVD